VSINFKASSVGNLGLRRLSKRTNPKIIGYLQIINAKMKDEDTLCCGREMFNCKLLVEKKARYNSHLKLLQKCMENNLTPKGFQIKWKLNLDAGIQSKRRVKDMLADTSKHLLSEAIKLCRNELCKPENRTSNLLSNMSTNQVI